MKLLSSPYKILFFGTDFFSLAVFKPFHQAIQTLPTLRKCASNGQNVIVSNLAAVCLPPLRRPTSCSKEPLRYYCQGHKIQVYDYMHDNIDEDAVLSPEINANEFDLGVVASFGQLIPSSMIEKFPYGIVNIHPSLLPKYRGSTPLQRTILNGDRNVGVTLFRIEPDRFDVGRIVDQRVYDVDCDVEKLTSQQLGMRLARVGSDMLLTMLTSNMPEVLRNARPQPSVPPELRAAYSARKFHESSPEAFIDWDTSSAIDVERQFRALYESFELKTWWNGSVIKLGKISLPDFEIMLTDNDSLSHHRRPSGSLYFHMRRKLLCVLCSDDRWIAVDRVVLPNKRPMTAADFYNGYLSKDGKYDGTFQSSKPKVLADAAEVDDSEKNCLLAYDNNFNSRVVASASR